MRGVCWTLSGGGSHCLHPRQETPFILCAPIPRQAQMNPFYLLTLFVAIIAIYQILSARVPAGNYPPMPTSPLLPPSFSSIHLLLIDPFLCILRFQNPTICTKLQRGSGRTKWSSSQEPPQDLGKRWPSAWQQMEHGMHLGDRCSATQLLNQARTHPRTSPLNPSPSISPACVALTHSFAHALQTRSLCAAHGFAQGCPSRMRRCDFHEP